MCYKKKNSLINTIHAFWFPTIVINLLTGDDELISRLTISFRNFVSSLIQLVILEYSGNHASLLQI